MTTNTKAILVAEKDERLRSDLKAQLCHQQFKVCEARDRSGVLRRLRRNSVDLTIIGASRDGNWDAPALVDDIRRRDRRLPIILIDAHGSEERAIAALRAGVKDYFKRPYSRESLISSINRNLAASRARASAAFAVTRNKPLAKCYHEKPLSPVLRQLLGTCLALKTTDAKTLAAHLHRSPATIRTQFQRILSAMAVHSRYAALKTAEDLGWLRAEGSRAEH
jgi:DNA-binding NtrC family response regulator